MIERILSQTIKAGLAEMIAEPDRIVQLFVCRRGLTQTEAEAVRDKILATPPNVIIQYPREDSVFPLFAIVLEGEQETTQYLDAFTRFVGQQQMRGSVWDATFAVWACSRGPDVTLYMYEILKDIILRYRNELVAAGIVASSMSGADMGPNEGYAPFWLFIRTLRMQATQQIEAFDRTVGVAGNIRVGPVFAGPTNGIAQLGEPDNG